MKNARELNLKIEGMHCEACVRRVTAALKQVEGVQVENVAVGSARLFYDGALVQPESISNAVNRIGFKVKVEVKNEP